MKPLKQLLVGAALILATGQSTAQIVVPDYGDTGWQTFQVTLANPFSGTVRIGVSNEGDTMADSHLLLDNFVNLGLANPGFETGDFTGWTLQGSGSVVTGASAYNGTPYTPTEGTYMARLFARGASTDWIDPLLPPGYDATDGAWLEFDVNIAAGTTVSFDWAFLAMDYVPYHDFAFLWSLETGNQTGELEILAYIDTPPVPVPVPEPGSLALVSLGLFGLAGAGMRKRKRH